MNKNKSKMELNLATNDELKMMCENLEKEFNDTKIELQKNYNKLTEISNEYNKIKSIINKREGK